MGRRSGFGVGEAAGLAAALALASPVQPAHGEASGMTVTICTANGGVREVPFEIPEETPGEGTSGACHAFCLSERRRLPGA